MKQVSEVILVAYVKEILLHWLAYCDDKKGLLTKVNSLSFLIHVTESIYGGNPDLQLRFFLKGCMIQKLFKTRQKHS